MMGSSQPLMGSMRRHQLNVFRYLPRELPQTGQPWAPQGCREPKQRWHRQKPEDWTVDAPPYWPLYFVKTLYVCCFMPGKPCWSLCS